MFLVPIRHRIALIGIMSHRIKITLARLASNKTDCYCLIFENLKMKTETFSQKLELEKSVFDNLNKEHKGYNKKPMAEVVEALRQYKASIGEEKTAYNADVEKFIMGLCKVSDGLKDYLGTEVYLAQKFLREEKKVKHQHEMTNKGYIPCKEWNGYIGLAHLIGKKEMDWVIASIDKIGKIIAINDGKDGFFIPKGKRSRGYYLSSFDEGFYKPINA